MLLAGRDKKRGGSQGGKQRKKLQKMLQINVEKENKDNSGENYFILVWWCSFLLYQLAMLTGL